MNPARSSVRILGTRGIPAAHGGFETFAEKLALHLHERDWDVTVYCQLASGAGLFEDTWRGIQRINIPVSISGAKGTVVFDWRCVWHAARNRDPCLVLGYNTAAFLAPLRAKRIPLLLNMDGIEWRRAKWGAMAKAWLFGNERAGGRLAEFIIADHPEIARYLSRFISSERITMIPYGAEQIIDADVGRLESFGVQPDGYILMIARLEPENSIEPIVRAFSSRPRQCQLVVVGPWEPHGNPYHAKIARVASDEVLFPGAVYDKQTVAALRKHCRLHVHGHQVGGTNPSLVEALGAGCAILAHDNRFNRWVAGDAARYFGNEQTCQGRFDELLGDDSPIATMRAAADARFAEQFTWESILTQYEELLGAAQPSR